MASLGIWYKSADSVSVETITSPKVEMFYWGTILFSQTLGTALGDWMADTNRLGYIRSFRSRRYATAFIPRVRVHAPLP
jgi:uncharacterized membrane-anchored protein